jgi:hypothetical protein
MLSLQGSMKKYLHWFSGLLILIAFAGGLLKTIQHHPVTTFQVDYHQVPDGQKPRFETDFASSKLHTQTHAASLVELKNGCVRAFWFSGSREGAKDVQIHSAVLIPRIMSGAPSKWWPRAKIQRNLCCDMSANWGIPSAAALRMASCGCSMSRYHLAVGRAVLSA